MLFWNSASFACPVAVEDSARKVAEGLNATSAQYVADAGCSA
jgi:hypothetical protein